MQVSRRGFFNRISTVLAASVLAKLVPSTVFAEERRRARPAAGGAAAGGTGPLSWPMVDPKSPAGSAVKYVVNKAEIKDAALKIERQGVKFDAQYCNNCSFYKEVGSKDGSKVGSCTIFANQLVKDQAWCSTWNKKA